MRRHLSPTLSLVVALVAITTPLGAASVRQFNLAEMTQRAAKIYVGTVRTATEGMVEIGGGRLAVVTYRLSVEEDLRGETPEVKGVRVAEFRMLGKQRPLTRGKTGSLFLGSPGDADLDRRPVISSIHDCAQQGRIVHDRRTRAGEFQA